jgi:hypothetical protein
MTKYTKIFEDERVRVVQKETTELTTYVIYNYRDLPEGMLLMPSGLTNRFGMRFFSKTDAEKHFQEAKKNPNHLIVKLNSQELID